MAPRQAAKASNLEKESNPEQLEASRLQQQAYDSGVVSKSKRLNTKQLPLDKALKRADGQDIVKKSSIRKGRYLLNICAKIAPAAAGRLGTLAGLDGRNPVLYMDFPEGRLKFLGTLVFPKNNYMVLKFGRKEVLCEDVLESMIVFPEAIWVGTAAENPEEIALPMPASLQTQRHENYAFRDEAADEGAAVTAQEGNTHRAEASGSEDDGDEEHLGSQEPVRQSQRTAKRPGKRPRYMVDIESDDPEDSQSSADEANEDDHQHCSKKARSVAGDDSTELPAKPSRKDSCDEPPAKAKPAAAKKAKQGSLDMFMGKPSKPDPPKSKPKPAPAPKRTPSKPARIPAGTKAPASSAKKNSAQKPKPKPTAARKPGACSSDDDAIEIVSSDEEDGIDLLSQPTPSQRPARAARTAAAKKLVEAPATESESDGNEDDSAGPSGENDNDNDTNFNA